MEPHHDHRLFPRQSVHLPAWIDVGDGERRVCHVWDISRSGARITMPRDDASALPEAFEIHFSDTEKLFCRVIWRERLQAGVKFLPEPRP